MQRILTKSITVGGAQRAKGEIVDWPVSTFRHYFGHEDEISKPLPTPAPASVARRPQQQHQQQEGR